MSQWTGPDQNMSNLQFSSRGSVDSDEHSQQNHNSNNNNQEEPKYNSETWEWNDTNENDEDNTIENPQTAESIDRVDTPPKSDSLHSSPANLGSNGARSSSHPPVRFNRARTNSIASNRSIFSGSGSSHGNGNGNENGNGNGSVKTGRESYEMNSSDELELQEEELVAGGYSEEDGAGAGALTGSDKWTFNYIATTVCYVLLWYVFSVSISVYNKWMFSPEHLDFKFPVFATCCHQLVMTGLAALVLGLVPASRPAMPFNTAGDYFRRVLPCATASCGDIGMGNASFRLVTLSFYTMVKSANLLFVLLFSIVFRLEQPTLRIFCIISIMTVGVLLMAAGETQFQVLGFFLVLGASMSSGLRWSLTQILLKRKSDPTNSPVYTILCLAPLMAVMLFVISMALEGPSAIFGASLWQTHGFFMSLGYLTLPGVLAFCMTLSEFLLLSRTSVLTLAIIGICKEVVTFGIAFLFFGDILTPLNALGVVVTTICILAYNYDRYINATKTQSPRFQPLEH